ncbi:hypothetical protein KKH56_05875 [bacterium]|nr:hypothetical protein [bacterium]
MRKLLIRSSGRQFFDVLEELLKEKDTLLDLLVTKDFRTDILKDYPLNKIYLTEGRKISVGSVSKETLGELTNNRYDEIVLLYNLTEFKGYDNVEDLAFYLKPGKLIGINIDSQRKIIKREKILRRAILGLNKQFWIVTNSSLFILVFIIYFIGFLLLEPAIILSRLIKQASK